MNATVTLPLADAVDYTAVDLIVDRVNASARANLVAWFDLFATCEQSDSPADAWKHAATTYHGADFKSRKCDVNAIRKAHPRLTPDAIATKYGSNSVQAIAARVRKASKGDTPDAIVTDAPTTDERIAAIAAAARLAASNGCTYDDALAALRSGFDLD
jgi:hypothetical protein